MNYKIRKKLAQLMVLSTLVVTIIPTIDVVAVSEVEEAQVSSETVNEELLTDNLEGISHGNIGDIDSSEIYESTQDIELTLEGLEETEKHEKEVEIETSENEVLEDTLVGVTDEVYDLLEEVDPSIEIPDSELIEASQEIGKDLISFVRVTSEAGLVQALEDEQIELIVLGDGLINISNPVYVNRTVTFTASTDGVTRRSGLNLITGEASLIVTEKGRLTIQSERDIAVTELTTSTGNIFISNFSGGEPAVTIDGGIVNLVQRGIYQGMLNVSGSGTGIDIKNGGELNNESTLRIITDIGISLNNGTFEDHPDTDYRQTLPNTSYIRAREQAVFSETGTNLHNFSHNRKEHESPVMTYFSSPTGVSVYKNNDNAHLTVTGTTTQLRLYNVGTEGEFISGTFAPDIRTGRFDFSVTQIGNDKPIINSITNESYSHLFGDGIFTAHRGLASLSVKENEEVEFTFRFTETEAYVTGYFGIHSDIEIPREAIDIDTGSTTPVPVVGIDPNALQDLGLTSVIFPETIRTIGNYAFADNSMLQQVTLNESVQTIGDYAFWRANLGGIIIPNAVKMIGERAFEYNNIVDLTLPDSLETLGQYAFRDNQLEKLQLSNRLEIIEEATFSGNKLTTIILPETIEEIKDGAFIDNNLISLIVPDRVKNIGVLAFASNEISTVYLGDGLIKVRGLAFLGSPLERIETSEDNVDHYKKILNTIDDITLYGTALRGVTKRTYLGVSQPRYTEETSLNKELGIGETLNLEAVSKNRYQLGDLTTYMFESITPIIEWYRDGTLLQNETNVVLSIENVEEKDSGSYSALIDGIQLPDIQVQVSPIINPDIPAINPDDAGPIVPENPNIGALSIRYISPLNFGEIPRSRNQQEAHSILDKDINGNDMPVMVTVQDMRPQNQRDGWELSVKQQDSFIDGAEIIMNPYVHESYSNELGIQVASGPITLNQSSQVFSGTNNGNPPGIVSLGLTQPADLGVRLRIPSGVGLGSYSTTLEWMLSTGP